MTLKGCLVVRNFIYFICMFLLVLSCHADNWFYEKFEMQWGENINDPSVDKTERLKDFEQYDFSNLWIRHQNTMIGYIGNNYQRFYIHFNEIQKSKESPVVYLVSGKTKVKNNVNNFTGEIKLLHVYGMSTVRKKSNLEEYQWASKARDVDLMSRWRDNRFIVVVQYIFRENPKQNNSGVLNGTAKSYFYLKNNKILYDDGDIVSDGYANNLFVGTWKSYKTGVVKKCNFGNFRIPDARDLDIGTAEFIPSNKYLDNGWRGYSDLEGKQDLRGDETDKNLWWK